MSKSIPPGLQAHQAARRQQSVDALLEAAADLFIANGYAKTSMAQLAKTAGVSPATMYKAFSSKEALFRAMVARELRRAQEPFIDGVPSFATGRQAAEFIVKRLSAALTNPRIQGLTWLAMAEGRHFPELSDIYRTQKGEDQTQALGELVFSALIQQGLFRPCHVPTAVRQFLGMTNQALLHEPMVRGEPIPDQEAYLEACVDLFCREYEVETDSDVETEANS